MAFIANELSPSGLSLATALQSSALTDVHLLPLSRKFSSFRHLSVCLPNPLFLQLQVPRRAERILAAGKGQDGGLDQGVVEEERHWTRS